MVKSTKFLVCVFVRRNSRSTVEMADPHSIGSSSLLSQEVFAIFWKMDVYAEAWIKGLEENKMRTCVDMGCGTNPKWKYNRMTLPYYDPFRNHSLVVQLMAKRSPNDKIIGSLTVSIRHLFLVGKGEGFAQFKVCMKSGKTKGSLKLYYDFESQQLETNAQVHYMSEWRDFEEADSVETDSSEADYVEAKSMKADDTDFWLQAAASTVVILPPLVSTFLSM